MTADQSVSRRRFLQLSAVAGVAAAAPIVITQTVGSGGSSAIQGEPSDLDDTGPASEPGPRDRAAGEPTGTGDVLVVVHLDGGNDGLNTVVPITDGSYSSIRGGDAVQVEDQIPLDSDFALASMPYLAERWNHDELAIVHGVGIIDGSLSHFAASDVWEAGSVDFAHPSGWLGRSIEHLHGAQADPLAGVAVGAFSRSLVGSTWSPLTLPSGGDLPWSAEFVADHPGVTAGLELMWTEPREGLGAAVMDTHAVVRDVGERIDAARPANDGDRAGGQPGIARDLNLVADVINADLGTSVFHLRHGGFDTHANQAANHPGLLAQLDEALASFHARLGSARSRVTVMTWTEFGRRVAFNGSGTDHGTSSVGLVLGTRVVGGHHGDHPDLRSLDRAGNPAVTTDFRDYLAGVVSGTLGVPPDVVAASNSPLEVMA